MNQFKKLLLIAFILVPGFALAATPNIAPTKFVEGKNFKKMPQKIQTELESKDGKVAVVEFFSYGCPWCFHLEPTLEKWLKTKPKAVEFHRVPAVFRPSWEILAKAYYTAVALGIQDKISPALFTAIQVKRMNLSTEPAMAKFFESQGVSKADFDGAFNFSPGIDAQLVKGRKLMMDYQVFQIPTIIINGEYKTDPQMAGGFEKVPAVINFLVTKVKAEQAAAAKASKKK